MRRGTPILLLLLVACSQFSVKSRFDPSANFGRLRTYAWLPPEEAEPADQRLLDRYLDKRLRTAVETELRTKGYAPATADAPDFLVNYRLATEAETSNRGGRAFPSGSTVWGGWGGTESAFVESYDAGTLYIAVIDGSSRRMVWIGYAQARLLSTASLERKAERVDAATHQILASFPAKGASVQAQ